MKTGFEKLESLMDWSIKTLTELQNNYNVIQHDYFTYEMEVCKPDMTIYFDVSCYLNEQKDDEGCGYIEPKVNISDMCKFEAFDRDGEYTEYNPTIQELETMRVKFIELLEHKYECGLLKL